MKILHVSFSKYGGGAGASARRLNNALPKQNVESNFLFLDPFDQSISGVTWIEKKINGLQNVIIGKLLGHGRSLNLFPSRILKEINMSDADVVHLHWIHGEMLSIKQIAKISKPLVWTFHDMWPFSGIEHCVEDEGFVAGYASGRGINAWVYRKKIAHWKKLVVQVVCPSHWMSECVLKSNLFKDFPVRTIANALDLSVFMPGDKIIARKGMGLPVDKKLILAGANSGSGNKGGYLLEEALKHIKTTNVELVVFGEMKCGAVSGIVTHCMGEIGNEAELATLYSASDVMCVPSRIESFGLTAAEPLACGIPVVAFDTTGLKDVVDHKWNGYLATPYDVMDFALGIDWVLNKLDGTDVDSPSYEGLCMNARQKAESCFSEQVVAARYIDTYRSVVDTFSISGCE